MQLGPVWMTGWPVSQAPASPNRTIWVASWKRPIWPFPASLAPSRVIPRAPLTSAGCLVHLASLTSTSRLGLGWRPRCLQATALAAPYAIPPLTSARHPVLAASSLRSSVLRPWVCGSRPRIHASTGTKTAAMRKGVAVCTGSAPERRRMAPLEPPRRRLRCCLRGPRPWTPCPRSGGRRATRATSSSSSAMPSKARRDGDPRSMARSPKLRCGAGDGARGEVGWGWWGCVEWRAPGSPAAGAGGRRGRVAAGGGTGGLAPQAQLSFFLARPSSPTPTT